MATELFTIPIPPMDDHQGGTIIATSPKPLVYLLTISSPPDNRLTTPLCHALTEALTTLQHTQPTGVVITTSAMPKFYSNGLDLAHASETPGFWTTALYRLWRKLLTYPMPTVAVINGHAFAAGLMTAMYHDYRIMNPSRGYACLNEIDFGALLKAPMSSIFREKVSPATYRSLVLEGRRFTGKDALEAGIVDALGGVDEAIKLVEERGISEKGKSGVWGLLKAQMYPQSHWLLTEEGFNVEQEKEDALTTRDDEEKEQERQAFQKRGSKL